jgi:ribosome biogenesis ATPase
MNEFVTRQWKSNQPTVPSSQAPQNEANGDSQTPSAPAAETIKRKASSTALLPKRRKRISLIVWTDITEIKNDWSPPTNVSLKDVGGIEEALTHDLMEYIAYPLLRPDVYVKSGIRPPR